MEDGAIGKFNSPQQLMRLLETDLSTKAQWAALALKMGRLEEATTVMAEVIREKKHLTVNERFVFALAYQERAKECRETCHCIEKRRRVEHQECERAMTIVHESVEYELSDMLHELCVLLSRATFYDIIIFLICFWGKTLL
ncbi:unnamed protein product [Gongylonema pulchrum]|uniref:14_3_3 domain-containing protein n=1 Tax=Gongylonema pulchrum TaxID=637853 RepID=A0A183D168_9BILA|nr:unnamed protein product [Gongylonema pulchrum]